MTTRKLPEGQGELYINNRKAYRNPVQINMAITVDGQCQGDLPVIYYILLLYYEQEAKLSVYQRCIGAMFDSKTCLVTSKPI